MGLRMKNFNIMGVYWKIQFLGWVTKNQHIAGNYLEKMGLPKKRLGGGGGVVDTPMHTMVLFRAGHEEIFKKKAIKFSN